MSLRVNKRINILDRCKETRACMYIRSHEGDATDAVFTSCLKIYPKTGNSLPNTVLTLFLKQASWLEPRNTKLQQNLISLLNHELRGIIPGLPNHTTRKTRGADAVLVRRPSLINHGNKQHKQ